MSDKLAVYQSIATITGDLAKEGIQKGRKNLQQGFAYRGIDDVYAALSTLLAEHKLCILPRVVSREATERTSAKGGVLFYTAVTVDFDLVSAIDGSRHTVTAVGEAFDSGDKSIGKAQSYAYKAMAFMLFAIPVEGQDNDPDANSHNIQPKTTTQATKSSSDGANATQGTQTTGHVELSVDQKKYFPLIKTALDSLYGADVEQKKTLIKRLTAFKNKEDKDIPGIEDYRKKDGKGLQILCKQIQKMAADALVDAPSICNSCRKPETECICEVPL